jgi:hypothetical protein
VGINHLLALLARRAHTAGRGAVDVPALDGAGEDRLEHGEDVGDRLRRPLPRGAHRRDEPLHRRPVDAVELHVAEPRDEVRLDDLPVAGQRPRLDPRRGVVEPRAGEGGEAEPAVRRVSDLDHVRAAGDHAPQRLLGLATGRKATRCELAAVPA